jgi:hypothetical protein
MFAPGGANHRGENNGEREADKSAEARSAALERRVRIRQYRFDPDGH